ncbi:MAG: SAF domain-containing protein [Fimbriiglobus sp.]|jgi:hypothetical protein|nr:SAF domain-containing protein [Fimbriiglobus sp.]
MNKTVLTILIPLGLGITAGVFNLLAVRAATGTVDLTVVKDDLKGGTVLTAEMLGRLSVRADPGVFRSAVKYEDRGVLIGRSVNRPLAAGEVLLVADVRSTGTFDVRANLRAGERTLTLTVKQNRVVPGLRVGDEVEVLVHGVAEVEPRPARDAGPTYRPVGPFRVVGLDDRSASAGGGFRDDERQVVVAYAAGRDIAPLERAHRGEGQERVVGIEFARPNDN